MEKAFKLFAIVMFALSLAACEVGPNYVRPTTSVPPTFKETPKGWKVAEPRDAFDRGQWWTVFHDAQLNQLEAELNISNQSIAAAAGQYLQAQALVNQARAAYFPTLSGALAISRQKSSAFFVSNSTSAVSSSSGVNSSTGTISAGGRGGSSANSAFTSESLVLNASWEPDLWGAVRRSVEASQASAQAFAAQLASVRLSSQASLAQYYFELRGVDNDQILLNKIVKNYRNILKFTQQQYLAGTVAQADVVQAKSQLAAAEAQAIGLGVVRAHYEHAIAMLIGKPASAFSIPAKKTYATVPTVPVTVPSVLLERRPDIAQAERLMAQANAQIGVAISTYFPAFSLSASGTMNGNGSIGNWLAHPIFGWALGPQLAQTFFDGGLRSATIAAARANYTATVGTYQQTVLAAFQDVEDNLASIRILKQQETALDVAAREANTALRLVIDQYRAGVVPFSSIITAQTNVYTAEKNALDTRYLRMTSTVGLIKALGGGWQV